MRPWWWPTFVGNLRVVAAEVVRVDEGLALSHDELDRLLRATPYEYVNTFEGGPYIRPPALREAPWWNVAACMEAAAAFVANAVLRGDPHADLCLRADVAADGATHIVVVTADGIERDPFGDFWPFPARGCSASERLRIDVLGGLQI